jgi:cytochrome c oxidase cbb3-type subunit 2
MMSGAAAYFSDSILIFRRRMSMTSHNLTRFAALACFLIAIVATSPAQESHIGSLTGDAKRGKQLYGRYCFGCHGTGGDGQGENAPHVDPRPRDFTIGTFKCRSTPSGSIPLDKDLFDTIGRGLYSTAMPPWLPLTRQQRADLVAYVKSFSPRFVEEKPGTGLEIPQETPSDEGSVARGQELYQSTMKCSQCHGKQGRGDGPSAPTLTDDKGFPIRPYDFTVATRFKCGESDEDLYRVLMTGLDGSPMPSFSSSLKPEQTWDLVHYVRTLRPDFHEKAKKTKREKTLATASGGSVRSSLH